MFIGVYPCSSAFQRFALASLLAAASLAAHSAAEALAARAAQRLDAQAARDREEATWWSPAIPLAVDAGLAMLAQGGSAVDATIATQLVLGLVEPQASGLGGGAFFLHYDAKAQARARHRRRARRRPPAPARSSSCGADGKPMPFQAAVVGGRSVGVPGTPRLLEVAHARHGKLPWAALFEPAIELAEKGFPMSPRVFTLARRRTRASPDKPAARAYFFDAEGKPKPVGTLLQEPGVREDAARHGREGRGRVLHRRGRRGHRRRRARRTRTPAR